MKACKKIISIFLVITLLFGILSVNVSAHNISDEKDNAVLNGNSKVIIFLPGIICSDLYADFNGFTVQMWLIGNQIFKSNSANNTIQQMITILNLFCDLAAVLSMYLACDEEGNPKNEAFINPDGGFGVMNIYKNAYQRCVEEFSDEYDVAVLEYDWRYSLGKVDKELEEFVDEMGYEDIVLVAHSMGGHIASTFLANEENRKKTTVINVATPLLGSQHAVATLEKGSFYGGIVDVLFGGVIKKLTRNIIPAYELAPAEQLYSLYNTSYIQKTVIGSHGVQTTNLTGEEATELLDSRDWVLGRNWFADKAQTYYDHIFSDGRHPMLMDDANCFYIVGYGYQTEYGFHYIYDENGKLLYCKPLKTDLFGGDGSITVESATLFGDVPEDRTYYVPYTHNEIINRPDVDELIVSMIENKDRQNPQDYIECSEFISETLPDKIPDNIPAAPSGF